MSNLMKKVIVCDLDGTLAESKSSITGEMSEVLCRLLTRYYLAVISGGAFPQFEKQFISKFVCSPDLLKKLYLFPASGSTCFKYGLNQWEQVYNEKLTPEEREKIKYAFKEAILELKLDLSPTYGELLEDRGTQITFSGHGQEAPIEVKEGWDQDQIKRTQIINILKKKIPEFEMRMGGTTSIDVTRKGIDKSYAITKIKNILGVSDEDIIFIGDALYKGGNDSSIKKTGVDFIQKEGPNETMEFLRQFI